MGTDSKEDGKQFARPVIVHRAMLGSVERMFAVLCEHWGGKWPFWISPRQVMVIPVHADHFEYAEGVRRKIHDAGFYVDVDLGKNKFPKKSSDGANRTVQFPIRRRGGGSEERIGER